MAACRWKIIIHTHTHTHMHTHPHTHTHTYAHTHTRTHSSEIQKFSKVSHTVVVDVLRIDFDLRTFLQSQLYSRDIYIYVYV